MGIKCRKAALLAGKSLALALLCALALASAGVTPGVGVAAAMEADGYAGGSITLTGHGTVSVDPDVARLYLGAEAHAESAREAQERVSTVIHRTVQQLRLLGAAPEDIETTQVGLYPEWDRPASGEELKVRRYRAVHDLRVTVRDLAAVGAWIDAAIAQGVNRLNGLRFEVLDGEAHRDEALRRAIADAQRQAQVAAEAAGVALGPVLDIQVGAVAVPYYRTERYAMAGLAAADATEVHPSQVTFEATVTITYGLVNADK